MPPHYIEPISRYVEQISCSLCSDLLYLSSQPASGRAEPIIYLLTCSPTCQWKSKQTHWTCTSFTSTCWWWKTNPIKIFGGRFWSYSRVVRFYLQFNPRCTSRGFNYHSIFLHDTTWMLDVPHVGKRRQTGGVGNTTSPVCTSYYVQAHLMQSRNHHISRPPCDT